MQLWRVTSQSPQMGIIQLSQEKIFLETLSSFKSIVYLHDIHPSLIHLITLPLICENNYYSP